MLNVHELERAWFRYKLKSYIPLSLAITLTALLIILGLIYWPKLLEEKKVLASNEPNKETVTKTEIPQTLNVAVSPTNEAISHPQPVAEMNSTIQAVTPETEPVKEIIKETSEPALVLKPSMDFLYGIEQEEIPSSYPQSYNLHSIQPVIKNEPVVKKEPFIETAPVSEVPEIDSPVQTIATPVVTEIVEDPIVSVETEQVPKISIIAQEDEDDLNDVIRRFKQNKNPALSLFVAKRYYSIGAYQKAYNYALMTNDIDSDIEESWLIFASSLVKLDQKEMAIKTLKSYLKKAESTKARHLLNEIIQGSFQ